MTTNTILLGNNLDTLKTIPDNSIDCCVTSPPYFGLRDYGIAGQIGLEDTPETYIEKLVKIFNEVKRVLKDDGTLWVNIGDSYAGSGKGRNVDGTKNIKTENSKIPNKGQSAGILYNKYQSKICKPKDLIGIPWMLAFALRADGWYLRQDIIWHKPNVMPESVTDRCTKAHEYIFLLTKSPKYYFNNNAISEPAVNRTEKVRERVRLNEVPGRAKIKGLKWDNYTKRNKRDVWTVNAKPYTGAHFAVFPESLILPCILSGCPESGIVLDPFMGSGTTALVAIKNMRRYIGCEINPDYIKIAEERLKNEKGLFDV